MLFYGQRLLETKKEGAVRMNFELNKFYMHHKGRCIAIVGKIKTYRWGEMLIVEEVDRIGHGISCIETEEERNENWTEIGKEEWLGKLNENV